MKNDEDESFGVMETGDPTGTVDPTASPESTGGTDGGEGDPTLPAETSAGESTGDAGGCGAASRCMTKVPDDWMGPIAIHRGDMEGTSVPACADGFPSAGLTMLEGFNDPGPAICDCECGVNFAALCNTMVYSCSFTEQVQLGNDCEEFALADGAYFQLYQSGQVNCQAEKITTIPEVEWDAMVSSCAGALQGEEECVGGGVCTPNAPAGMEEQLCIFSQGDHACPAGDFSEKVTVHSGTDDTRTCGVCWCGMGTATCSGTLDVFSSEDCSGTAMANVAPNTGCDAAAAGSNSMLVSFTGTQDCPVMELPTPSGDVAAAGEFTYCCEAP